MAVSPSTSGTLYGNPWRAAILVGLVWILALTAPAQFAQRPKPDKGPRALGLLELAPNGKAHLIPVVIMYNSEFYDASAYKADPVPMALDSGTVYEAERGGESQGLFTVSGALAGPNNTWTGAGTWLPAGAHPPSKGHRAESEPRGLEEKDEPPVLRRSEPKKPEAAPEAAPEPAASTPSSPTPQPESPKTPPPAPPAATPPAPAASAPPATTSAPATQEADEDSGRPVLRRGKPSPTSQESMTVPSLPPVLPPSAGAAKKTVSATKTSSRADEKVQVLPAISDAGGPEPHSYAYPLKAGEEPQLRQKVLAMAAVEVEARAKRLASEMIGAPAPKSSRRRKVATKPPQPSFEDVQFHVFDLSSSNEPLMVLTARAQMPPGPESGPASLQYMVTFVARQDIYGDLQKVFSNVTDTQHLDVLPRYDFIDAVDVDGDGRGELLFRRVSDAGSAYTVFRVIGQQVWPLFEGRLQ
jgi:hypothetical protein